MRNWVIACIVILLFICATFLCADKFGGPRPHQPGPPPDTTQVDAEKAEAEVPLDSALVWTHGLEKASGIGVNCSGATWVSLAPGPPFSKWMYAANLDNGRLAMASGEPLKVSGAVAVAIIKFTGGPVSATVAIGETKAVKADSITAVR